MESQFPLFLLLLFLSVFFISQALILPSAGKKVKHKQLIKRIHESHKHIDQESISLLRENSLKNLSPLERWLVRFSLFESFKKSSNSRVFRWGSAALSSSPFYLGWRSVYCSICGGKSGTCVLGWRSLVGPLRTFICKRKLPTV